jgi:hypothetical protein
MDKLKEQQNRGYVIAGIGGAVAFIAFFLPYVTISAFVISISFSGSTIASNVNGLLWFELLAALVAVAVPLVLIYRSSAFGFTSMPLEKQIRYGIFTIIGAGALGLLAQLIVFANLSGYLTSYNSTGSSGSGVNAGVSLGIGWWLYLLAAIAIVAGGVMAQRSGAATAASPSAWQYSSTQYPPYSQSSYPVPPTQYPQPYGQQYPTGDQPSQYPSYQYPTLDQQNYIPTELKQSYPQTGPAQQQGQQYDPTELRPYPQTGPGSQQLYPPQPQQQQQWPPKQ